VIFSPIFGEKLTPFLKTDAMIKNAAKTSSILKKSPILSPTFWRKYF
jgi:hypothetical protein